jgi:hypothetical protein
VAGLAASGSPAWSGSAVQDHHLIVFIVVGRSTNPDGRGTLTCYLGFSGGRQAGGSLTATKLLERVVPHYSS